MGDLMSDKIRDEFDAWYFGMFPLEREMIGAGSASSARNRDLYLRCWTASRAALVIDLPPTPTEPDEPDDAIDDSYMDAYYAAQGMRHACAKAIEAAGLKVAP